MKQYLFFLLLLPILVACEKEDTPGYQLGGDPATVVVPVAKGDAGRLEMPKLRGTSDELFIVHRTAPSAAGRDSVVNFAYAYDIRKFHSRWVAFRFDSDTRPKRVDRKSYSIRPQYPRDPKLPAIYALQNDASFNGYDHGHLVASADRLYSREGNDQTFYLSNMSPQDPQFNQSYWVNLEQLVQTLGRDEKFSDTLYVVKGGTIDRDDYIWKYVSSNRVPVPKYHFMALLRVKNNTYSAIAFWLENKDYGKSSTKADLATHILSVRELESLTGIDFFHNLPDAIEQQVEGSPTLSTWGF